jgi:hypothetical protein
MTSGKAGLPQEIFFAQAEGVHAVVPEAGAEDDARDAGQGRGRARGEAAQLVELDGGRHPQLYAELVGRQSQRVQGLFRHFQDYTAHLFTSLNPASVRT